ncbi:MFS transporter [Fervidibacter sp.]|jgi:MFS family permease
MAEGQEQRVRWYEGLTGYHWLVLTVAALGWAFDTMDQWLYVLARQPAMAELLRAAPEDPQVAHYAGIVQAIFLFGWATGGFLFGIVGDKWGRTRTMIVTILLYAGFTGLIALTQNWYQFAVCRFLVGLGVGGEFASGAALVAEVFPPHARPMALGIMQASSAIGNMTAGFINLTVGASSFSA